MRSPVSNPWLAALLFFSLSPAAQAGEIFRWTDENGQVHFGSSPPGGETKTQTVEVKGASRVPEPTEEHGYAYCEDQPLPGPLDNPLAVLTGINKKLPKWKAELTETEQQLADLKKRELKRLAKYGVGSNRLAATREPEFRRTINRYRCMIGWGNQMRVELAAEREKLLAAPRALEQQIAAEEGSRDRTCGSQPKVEPSHQLYLDWYYCREPFETRLRRLKKELRYARRHAARLE